MNRRSDYVDWYELKDWEKWIKKQTVSVNDF